MATENSVKAALVFLAGSYPNVKIDDAVISAYGETLRRVSDCALPFAIRRVVERQKFFPAISEIMQEAESIEQRPPPSSRVVELYEIFFQTGKFAAAEWDALATSLDNTYHPDVAEYARDRKRRIELILAD